MNYQGPFGNTLLHMAAIYGDVDEIARLLAEGADPRIRNREGKDAIEVAVLAERPEVAALLSRAKPPGAPEPR
jgi:ankyrin repeat protein